MIWFYVIAHYDYLLKGIVDSFLYKKSIFHVGKIFGYGFSVKRFILYTFECIIQLTRNAKVRYLSEKKEFYSRKVSLMTKNGNENGSFVGFCIQNLVK